MNSNKMVKGLTQEELATIHTFYSAWQKKMPELLNEVCTTDWKDIPLAPDQPEGPLGLQQIRQKLMDAFPDIEVIVHEIFGTHERAGVRAEFQFTHHQEVLGIAPTHKKVSVALHEFHHLKNGKLTHTWHLEDWFGLLMQSKATK